MREVVESVARHGIPVWVMIDGSDDDSPEILESLESRLANVRVFRYPRNRGKGTVMLEAAQVASREGFTHLQSFDSDGQHPSDFIPRFLELSRKNPVAMILGK